MSAPTDTQKALDGHLAGFAIAWPIAWENTPFEPTAGTAYLRPTNMPIQTQAIGMGNQDSTQTTGYYQVDVFAPLDGGLGPAFAMADLVSAHFSRGLVLVSGDSKIVLGVPARDPATPGSAWLKVSVLIPYTTLSK